MFDTMTGLLKRAQVEGNAIASINIYSQESIRGALEAAQERSRPVILALAARNRKNLTLKQAAYLAHSCGEDIRIPYALHLDHCTDLETIQEALDAGFSSVMYDGCALPFEENVENTRQAVRWAREKGASIEAELGAISTGEHAAEHSGDEDIYTQPGQAAEFVERTGIDALAVSIGTVHGMYKGEPKIRIDLLRQIRDAVDIPLVLHGGSGTGKPLLQQAITNGIRKVNVNTEISMHCVEKLRNELEQNPYLHLSDISLSLILFFRDAAGWYIDLLGMR